MKERGRALRWAALSRAGGGVFGLSGSVRSCERRGNSPQKEGWFGLRGECGVLALLKGMVCLLIFMPCPVGHLLACFVTCFLPAHLSRACSVACLPGCRSWFDVPASVTLAEIWPHLVFLFPFLSVLESGVRHF